MTAVSSGPTDRVRDPDISAKTLIREAWLVMRSSKLARAESERARNPGRIASALARASRAELDDERPCEAGWFVYVLRCRDGTLYTGVTTDVDRRRRQHDAGTAARYTRGRGPVAVVHFEPHATRGAALRRERALKRLSRAEKLGLIARG